jgi:hypothetical protein
MRVEINNSIIKIKKVEMLIDDSDDSLLCVDYDNKKYILQFSHSRYCKLAYNELLANGYISSWRYNGISELYT